MAQKTRKRRRNIFNISNQSPIIGAGGYGLIIEKYNYVLKLLYDTEACRLLQNEATIQERAFQALQGIINVPRIISYKWTPKTFRGQSYLCGIAMERAYGLPEYDDQLIHMMLGSVEGLAEYQGRSTSEPVGPTNPSRGFFASTDTLLNIWDDNDSEWTIDNVAYIMGRTYRALINAGIVPIDLEFVYGSDDKIYCLDFGLCTFGSVSDLAGFLTAKGRIGLGSEPYIPGPGMQGRDAFLQGYFATN